MVLQYLEPQEGFFTRLKSAPVTVALLQGRVFARTRGVERRSLQGIFRRFFLGKPAKGGARGICGSFLLLFPPFRGARTEVA